MMQRYAIMLVEPNSRPSKKSEEISYLQNRHGDIRKDVQQFIQDNGLDSEVDYLGKAMVIPTLFITCSESAAKKIAKLSSIYRLVQTSAAA